MPVGVILMDDESAVEGTPAEQCDKEYLLPWAVQDPAAWPVPLHTVMAKGADSETLLQHTAGSVQSVVDSARKLDGQVQLIIGNCGFMWAAKEQVQELVGTPTITSGLDFLDLALGMTNQQVGLITYSAESLTALLKDHEQRDRLRILGLSDMPDWAAIAPADYMERGGWTMDGLREQLLDRLVHAFAENGELAGVKILVLECTGLANFRSEIRKVSRVPVLDIVSIAIAAIS
ncbi:aspartate/glutamate racemase family protein [Prauserella flavalba]|uniref:aspartate/glutamate racemase family protein n=1 Tax=Prauserella flavalba TaxID=1477506 RepID=UPI0036F0DC66